MLDAQRTENLLCGNHFAIPQGGLNPMQRPLSNKKVLGITALVAFLIVGLMALFVVQYESPEQKAFREWTGVKKITPWSLYALFVGGACVLYILSFKVSERRQKYLGPLVSAAGFICVILIPSEFHWRGAIVMAIMLAIVLIGWLYPARNSD